MITAIVVVCITVLLIVAIACFVFGWKAGRAKIEHEIAQDTARKEADKKYYEGEKAKIKAGLINMRMLSAKSHKTQSS